MSSRRRLAEFCGLHRRALVTIGAAAVLDIGLGCAYAVAERIPLWHGLYCALADAVTIGGDVNPSGWGYAVAAAVCLTVVPLFAATFSLFTSGLTAAHVRTHVADSEDRIKAHIEARLPHHLRGDRQNDAAGFPPTEGTPHDPADS